MEVGFLHKVSVTLSFFFLWETIPFSPQGGTKSPPCQHHRGEKSLLSPVCYHCVSHTCYSIPEARISGLGVHPRGLNLFLYKGIQHCSDTRSVPSEELAAEREHADTNQWPKYVDYLIPSPGDGSQKCEICWLTIPCMFSLQTCGGWQLNRLREVSHSRLCNHRNKKNRQHTSISMQKSVCSLRNTSHRVFHRIPPQICR